MDGDRPHRICIVGGGSAGWMAAALFARLLGRHHAITLVESDEIGTVGVGEATIPPIKQFNALLGIDEAEFLRATGGTFKLGIRFRGWGAEGEGYVHGFGPIGQNLGFVRAHAYWLAMRARGATLPPLDAHVITAQAALAGRFAKGVEGRPGSPLNDLTYAYHFDAALYAGFLRTRAEAGGVRRVEGRIDQVSRDGATGAVTAVRLSDGREIAADLWIDCSGFRALLIGEALGTGFADWSHWLPCDRALAVPSPALPDLPPYTRATAHGAGWQWRIPLQGRTGNGIVYASGAIGDDEANARLLAGIGGPPLADPRPIRFRTGRRRQAWVGNVVALGLAAGFLEPLESTSLHLVQSALLRLVALFPGSLPSPAAIETFNRQTASEWEHVRDFLILHYRATRRADSEFWRACAAMSVPDSLAARLALFAENGRVLRDGDELFAPESWIQVMIGQGLRPLAPDPLVDLHAEPQILAYLADIRAVIARCVEAMPPQAVTLRRMGAARA